MDKTTNMTWHTRPVDQGQIVEVSYAVDWENEALYRRIYDQSDRSEVVQVAHITGGEFEPWNGLLPEHGPWRNGRETE